MRSWEDLTAKLALDDNREYYWRQIIYAIPCAWKEMFLECGNNICDDLIILTNITYSKNSKSILQKN